MRTGIDTDFVQLLKTNGYGRLAEDQVMLKVSQNPSIFQSNILNVNSQTDKIFRSPCTPVLLYGKQYRDVIENTVHVDEMMKIVHFKKGSNCGEHETESLTKI